MNSMPPAYYTPGVPTLPPGWVEYRTATGQPYWYNTATHLSSWVFPFHSNLTLSQPKKRQIKKKIPNTHWLFVLTPDGYEFFYDRDTKTSVWEMPPELKEPMEELKKLEAQQKEEEQLKKQEEEQQKEEEEEHEAKRIKLQPEEEEEEEEEEQQQQQQTEEATEMTEDDIMWQLQQMGDQDEDDVLYIEPEHQEPEAPKEEEPEQLKESKTTPTTTNTLSEEDCIAQFNQLLEERNISPFAVYSVEYPQLMTDPRFSLVPQQKQKVLFNKYCHQLGEKLKHQNKAKKKPEEEFRELLESKVTEKMYWDDFRRKYKHDPRFKAIPATREKEALFKEYVRQLGKQKTGKEAYLDLLRHTKEIKVGIRWRDAKKILEKDSRFYAIESKIEREDVFRDYLEGKK